MNIPLSWLSEYINLPKDTTDLTQKLTSIGHMLDKVTKDGGETVIDLELRGNRPDLLGLIGIAREISVVYNIPLKHPPVLPLPIKDSNLSLVKVDPKASDLVTRYTAFTLKTKVGPSPSWLRSRLQSWGLPSINNVVDITNYVMIETGQPLHAFDLTKLAGHRLILRHAKNGEKFATIQQGQTLFLNSQDLVICDANNKPQALTMIGGFDSKVTGQTTEILLESAVYNQANCRQSSRRLKVITDSSTRHEKLLHPDQVQLALERAYYLLKELASAQSTSKTSDYYPKVSKPTIINFNPQEVSRLGGISIPPKISIGILKKLEFQIIDSRIYVPTFRTDIEDPADLVEEVLRIYGYDKIPSIPISSPTPIPNTYPSYSIQEKIRDILTKFGINEVITLSMIPNTYVSQNSIKLINPPDPDKALLRHSLIPGLIEYTNKTLNLSVFEIGKIFLKNKGKFIEQLHVGLATTGTVYDLTGIIQTLTRLLGVSKLDTQITNHDNTLLADININNLTPRPTNPYSILSQYPPIIEDLNIIHSNTYENLINQITKISPLIKQINLIDKYKNRLTLRITYHSDTKQLSSKDIKPIRAKLTALVSESR